MHRLLKILVLAVASLTVAFPGSARADALARLKPEKLEAVNRAISALVRKRQELRQTGPFRDYRANLHVHSALSHDSRGKIEDIVAAANKVGTHILMFTEHPSERYDYFKDGHHGLRNGVLLIPGAETEGFLAFPTRSFHGLRANSPQEFSDLIRSRGGLVFLSHLEERMSWEIRGLTGVEIYNIHADFKDEKNLQAAMRNPLWIIKTAELIRKYPQEAFSALQDYPADYLRRWDELCRKARHTGIAANDAHQNVGLSIRLEEAQVARIDDALGEKLFQMKLGTVPLLQSLARKAKVGDELFEIQFDRYEHSLRHVGTHLLLKDLSQEAVWDALQAGRAYVAFDWLADATGFDFAALGGTKRYEMGAVAPYQDGLKLQARAPLPVHWKGLRDGILVADSSGREFSLQVTRPGNYRVEAWLDIAGEEMVWILSNPVYVDPTPVIPK